MKLNSIELLTPSAAAAAAFLSGVWGAEDAGARDGVHYIRGSGPLPYLVAIGEAAAPAIRSVTFGASGSEIARIAAAAATHGLPCRATRSTDLGGGEGIVLQLPDGEVFRFLDGVADAAVIEGRPDLPVKLTHVVMNATDAEASGRVAEDVLGFRVSDRTRGMVFVRCNASHHSIAFARAGFASLNHIAFEMADIDAVMRGIGRMRDAGAAPSWGPGRHGPGDNVFAYFIAPFGAVVEFSTAVEIVPDDYAVGAPEDWTWPPGRIDQWGLSDKDTDALGIAERTYRFAPLVP